MMTPTTVLLVAGTAASLVAVWMLSGLSERSELRMTLRVLGAAALGLACLALVYVRTPVEARAELSLPLFLAAVGVVSLAAGSAKLEAALVDRNGARVVRRSAGIISGAWLGMTAIGATSLGVSSSSLATARVGWSLMFGLVLATIVTFLSRARYAGVGFLSLGARTLVPALAGAVLVIGARSTAAGVKVRATIAAAAPVTTSSVRVVQVTPAPSESVAPAAPELLPPSASVASAVPTTSGVAPVAIASTVAEAPPASSDGFQIEALSTHAILEADVRGGINRRADRLRACLTEASGQRGTLSLKVAIDSTGSVSYSRATGGDLAGTPLGNCLLGFFYKVGFAAPASSNARFEITLRVP